MRGYIIKEKRERGEGMVEGWGGGGEERRQDERRIYIYKKSGGIWLEFLASRIIRKQAIRLYEYNLPLPQLRVQNL